MDGDNVFQESPLPIPDLQGFGRASQSWKITRGVLKNLNL